jgi:ABC-type multidrug transport system permease subunit
MKEDELEIWRRQWNSQPAVPIDLIRKVERQTVYLKLEHLSLILPGLIGVALIVAAVRERTIPWIIMAIGIWCFNLIGGYLQIKNSKDTWAPTTDTTSAYVQLSIARCHARLKNIRLFYVLSALLSAFVFGVNYLIIASYSVLKTPRDYAYMFGGFAYAAAVVGVVAWLMSKKGKKVQAELAYLMNLERQLKM